MCRSMAVEKRAFAKNKYEKTALSGGFSKTDILYFVPFNFLGLTRE